MAKRANIESRVESMVMPIIEEGKFELVDVEYVKEGANYYLRIYADKEGGINIDDCVTISRALEAKLDEDDFISDAYILEVSSPGLGRPLKKEKDFKRSIGKEIDIKLYKAINKQKEFTGVLMKYTEEDITLDIEGEEQTFARKDLALIRLALNF
ncbi:MAG: ribosome maturation factor RimP [Lachnospiraceae bacterium]|nr:ribosome maturation factor RimP [Lachnospiraceae bacterium]